MMQHIATRASHILLEHFALPGAFRLTFRSPDPLPPTVLEVEPTEDDAWLSTVLMGNRTYIRTFEHFIQVEQHIAHLLTSAVTPPD